MKTLICTVFLWCYPNQILSYTDFVCSQKMCISRPYSLVWIVDTFQDFLIPEHIKPRLHILEISIFSLKCVIVRPTQTPKSADKKANFWLSKWIFYIKNYSNLSNFSFFIEEYQFRGTYIVIGIFWKLQFLKPLKS